MASRPAASRAAASRPVARSLQRCSPVSAGGQQRSVAAAVGLVQVGAPRGAVARPQALRSGQHQAQRDGVAALGCHVQRGFALEQGVAQHHPRNAGRDLRRRVAAGISTAWLARRPTLYQPIIKRAPVLLHPHRPPVWRTQEREWSMPGPCECERGQFLGVSPLSRRALLAKGELQSHAEDVILASRRKRVREVKALAVLLTRLLSAWRELSPCVVKVPRKGCVV